MGALNEPYGGRLQSLYLDEGIAAAEKHRARDYPSWDLTPRQLCDIEQLLNGGFSPLRGFLNCQAYASVLSDMRLPDGTLWPVPIVLDVTRAFAEGLSEGQFIALRDAEGVLIATLRIDDIWSPDQHAEALAVYGTEDTAHPGVNHLLNHTHPVYLGGALSGIEAPLHYDFKSLRASPAALRARFEQLGWNKIIAFHTRHPLHRLQVGLTQQAAREYDAGLLLHPLVGMSPPGAIGHYTRVRCYQHILKHYPPDAATLSLLPLAPRLAGPREALWHAIIRKNYGCSHLIVGPDHGAPENYNSDGQPFYPQYAAQELFRQHQDELGIQLIALRKQVYVEEKERYLADNDVKPGQRVVQISNGELPQQLAGGVPIPDWFSYPEVLEELCSAHPPRRHQGFTVFFTGLSGSGKSTIANALLVKLMETGGRRVTLLDGDLVRKNLSSELSFSREHRDLNILRIGYVASEITANGGIAICAPIAPYASTRRQVREMIAAVGGFIEVYVATPLDVCEQRDRKGLYAKARAGLIKEFTGISDPYEAPQNAEVVIDTAQLDAEAAARQILLTLQSLGFID